MEGARALEKLQEGPRKALGRPQEGPGKALEKPLEGPRKALGGLHKALRRPSKSPWKAPESPEKALERPSMGPFQRPSGGPLGGAAGAYHFDLSSLCWAALFSKTLLFISVWTQKNASAIGNKLKNVMQKILFDNFCLKSLGDLRAC